MPASAPPPGASTREALLDAACDAVVAGEWARTRMLDVARRAGVSRQTLYDQFGSKDQLFGAVALRETERFLTGTEEAMVGHDGTPAEAVGSAVAFALDMGARSPLLKAVLTDDHGDLLPFLTTRAEPILAAARARIAAHLHDHWPALGDDAVDLAAETVVRLTVSHLVLPVDPVERTAARVAHLIDRLLAADATPTHHRRGTT